MRVLSLFVLVFFWVGTAYGEDDVQYWSQYSFSLYKKNPLAINFYAEARFNNDARHALGYFFGPTASYTINKNLSIGGAAKVIHFKSGDHFARIQRYEGEIKLSFKLLPKLQLKNRNRFEYFRRENRADTKRTRFRFNFKVPFRKTGRIDHFFFGNEFFYSADNGKFRENRLVPLGIRLRLDKKRSLNIYYLIQHVSSRSGNNHVLATTLFF